MRPNIILLICVFFLHFTVYGQEGGSNCDIARSNTSPLTGLFSDQSTCGKYNSFQGTPGLGNEDNHDGQDWFYHFRAVEDGFMIFDFLDMHTQDGRAAFITLTIFEGCPDIPNNQQETFKLVFVPEGETVLENLVLRVFEGRDYFLVVDAKHDESSFSFASCVNYDLELRHQQARRAVDCANIGFEDNTLTGWETVTGTARIVSDNAPAPELTMESFGVDSTQFTIVSTGRDPFVGISRVAPGGGRRSLQLGDSAPGATGAQVTRRIQVTQDNAIFQYQFAAVLEEPDHPSAVQPFFSALFLDVYGDTLPCGNQLFVPDASGYSYYQDSVTGAEFQYLDWITQTVDLSDYIGQRVTVVFSVVDCAFGSHFGYAYLDASCAPSDRDGPSTLEAIRDTVCLGDSITLRPPGGYAGYRWFPGGIVSETLTLGPLADTAVQLEVMSFDGCLLETQPYEVIVNTQCDTFPCYDNPFRVALPDTVYMCRGDTFNVIPDISGEVDRISWSGPDEIVDEQEIYARLYPEQSGILSFIAVDTTGCVRSQEVWLAVENCICDFVIDSLDVRPVSCFGATDGVLHMEARLPTGPLSWSWLDEQSGVDLGQFNRFERMPAGDYALFLYDAWDLGCNMRIPVTIDEPEEMLISVLDTVPADCLEEDGRARIQVSGGNGVYQIFMGSELVSSQADFTLMDVGFGNYVFTARDANSCEARLYFSMPEDCPDCGIDLSNIQIDGVRCTGENNGSASIEPEEDWMIQWLGSNGVEYGRGAPKW